MKKCILLTLAVLLLTASVVTQAAEFVWLDGLRSLGFLIETFEVDGNTRVLIKRSGTYVETSLGHYAAFVDYRQLMVLPHPSYQDDDGYIYVPMQILSPFSLPSDTAFPLPPEKGTSADLSQDIALQTVTKQDLSDPEDTKPTPAQDRSGDDVKGIDFYVDGHDLFRMRVELNAAVQDYTIFTLSAPDRVVIDLFGPTVTTKRIDTNTSAVTSVRIAQHEGGSARFVIDTESPRGYAAYIGDTWFEIELTHVANLEVSFDNEDGEAFFDLKNHQLVNAFELKDPYRIVLDFEGMPWTSLSEYITFDNGVLKQVRVSEFSKDPQISRVVLEARENLGFQVQKGTGDHLELALGKHIKPATHPVTSPVYTTPKAPAATSNALHGKTIVVDAGHGGSDPGAIRVGISEKDINLAVALEFASLLRQHGANVVMVRDSDTFVTLYDRAALANKAKADLFISIHANSHDNPNAHGIEVFYGWDRSLDFARVIERNLRLGLGRHSRGVKFYRYYVIRATTMPAVLVELGFITNEDDRQRFLKPDFAREHAQVLLRAVLEYLG